MAGAGTGRFFVNTVRILSIDGGGIRGIIPAMILAELRQRLDRLRKRQPYCRLFHLLAGTSTGSLITLGLTAPAKAADGSGYCKRPLLNAQDMVNIYEKRGLEIFPRQIFSQLQTMRQAFAGKYDSGNFDKVLLETFEDRTISDALANILVTSYDLESGRPLIIKKRPGLHTPPDPDFFMRDAARGSSAAPTYFEPVRVRTLNLDEHYTLIDGGMFANNPAMSAYVEARKIYPFATRFTILSLGTGRSVRQLSYETVKSWGFIDWVLPSNGVPMAMIMSKGQSESVNYQLQHLPRVDYIRLEPDLTGCNEAMDDASDKNIAALKAAAGRLINQADSELDRVASLL
ncbi:MAG: patatin-like phospholipase family protein [Spirochaetes bacterium]|nr:patatin-like phospholipase family protein [Spirochaetota bacterium]